MPALRKRTWKALAGALVAAALVVAPLVTAGASAAEPDAWPADTVGVKGELVEWSSETNHTDYWKQLYPDAVSCYSSEGNTDHGRITDGGKTVTLNEYNPSWPGDHWEVLVIKAGNLWNSVIENPKAGVAYASPPNNGGQQANVSHWIVCKGETPPTVVVPTLDVTPPTCLAEGSITRSENADWTFKVNADGTTTWTAKPKTGTVFESGVKVSWVVGSLSKLTEGCDSEQPEQPQPISTDKVETAFDCADTTATVTTTTTTTSYVWDAETESWVLGTPVVGEPVVTERPLTQDELGDCPLVPGEIESVCVGDVPFLGYEVTLPEGFETDDETPVTITFVNPEGEDYVVPGTHPLSSVVLWPGASNGTPKMWPGWELVNGEYVKTDGNFDWTRNGVTVRFEVNPSYETEVEYPAASALCANPPVGGGDDPSTPTTGTPASSNPEALAVTGGGISPMFAVAGGAVLLAGIATVAFAAYRRRHASAE